MELERVNGFAFEWQIATEGHGFLTKADEEWSYDLHRGYEENALEDDSHLRSGIWIVHRAPFRGYRVYNPLEDCPGLHRTFAALPLATEADDAAEVFGRYRAFADRYGLLTAGGMLMRSKGGTVDRDWRTLANSVLLWDREIRWFRRALRVWDGIQHNGRELSGIIVWSENGREVWHQHAKWRFLGMQLPSRGRTRIPPYSPAWRNYEPHDLKGPALTWLTSELNDQLSGHVSPYLTVTNRRRVSFRPDNLLNAMRVMLFLEVSGQSDLRQCEYCNNWFDAIKPDLTRRRADARYCSNSCKTQASRHRTKGTSRG